MSQEAKDFFNQNESKMTNEMRDQFIAELERFNKLESDGKIIEGAYQIYLKLAEGHTKKATKYARHSKFLNFFNTGSLMLGALLIMGFIYLSITGGQCLK